MEEYSLKIVAQSAFFKPFVSHSKDTGIYVPRDLVDFLGNGVGKNNEGKTLFSFIVYKDEVIKSMLNILASFPLYASPAGKEVIHSNMYEDFIQLHSKAESFFGNDESKVCSGVYLSSTSGNRDFLFGWDKNPNKFSIRNYLVADSSTLIFKKRNDGQIEIHIKTISIPSNNDDSMLKENTSNALSEKDLSTIPYFAAIRTKPFLLLAGISGTGKSRIVRKLAQATTTAELENCDEQTLNSNRWDLHKPANFEIIQVKPNWHNSMDVVGYQTNIPTPRYVFTPFVEFIAKAWQHPTVPFFLCLDEMNLAPVEEYFAEFLSAIESRSKKGDTYETDPIIKPFNDFNYEDEQGKIRPLAENMVNHLLPGYNAGNMPQNIIDLSKRFKEKGLTLPENLIVIGTVNMDETTFSFSRKVLDRAMSFEMNEVDYDSFLEDTADIITEPLTAKASTLLVDRPIKAQDVKDKVDADFIVSYLKAVNEKLDNTPFKLGYRAANEAILYVAASQNFCQKNIASVIDEFTTMKILSRIEGDTTKLRVDDNSDKTILDELETVINDFLKPANKPAVPQEEQPAEENANGEDNAPVEDVVVAAPVELKSLDKIKRMKEQLKRNSFVSYWD